MPVNTWGTAHGNKTSVSLWRHASFLFRHLLLQKGSFMNKLEGPCTLALTTENFILMMQMKSGITLIPLIQCWMGHCCHQARPQNGKEWGTSLNTHGHCECYVMSCKISNPSTSALFIQSQSSLPQPIIYKPERQAILPTFTNTSPGIVLTAFCLSLIRPGFHPTQESPNILLEYPNPCSLTTLDQSWAKEPEEMVNTCSPPPGTFHWGQHSERWLLNWSVPSQDF